MYPISASEKLSLYDIAEHWAGEIHPRSSFSKLFDVMVKAWWRGEFGPIEAARRPAILAHLYKYYQGDIAFVVPGWEEPEMTRDLPDGGVEILRFWRVPLPNDNSTSWNEVNCRDAFEAVAEAWQSRKFLNTFLNMEVGIGAGVKLCEELFTSWVRSRGYHRPLFWAEGTLSSSSGEKTSQKSNGPFISKPRGRRPKVLPRVIEAMRGNIAAGIITIDALRTEKEVILEASYRCSRDTARKARNAVISEIVAK
jgi:hypothetical protein